ncbi:preprotein translocase subunit SecE [Alienimonas californiensis]|uniref:Protein translocase subunit SecE n=1 Tax=Alienimonas californiensis TaxID=2527989 RepID=A0A517P8F9_9PLAN|nr:preprotein translocase subunit SecE [Alienimonas californiensis]QDT15657.1 preprotein translocase subunit SecE [Alienimonas californiensis]
MSRQQASGSIWSELLAAGLYKRNQGRIVRQATAAAVGLVVFIGCYVLAQGRLAEYDEPIRYGVPAVLLAAGCWFAFRLVNYPRFADFLISVEAEMAKVSWPTWPEVLRASLVVIAIMFLLAGVLFFYDMVWGWLFEALGVLRLQNAAPVE